MNDDLKQTSSLDALLIHPELTSTERERFYRLWAHPASSWGPREKVDVLLGAAIRGLIRSKRAVAESILGALEEERR